MVCGDRLIFSPARWARCSGGAAGGYVAAQPHVIELLQQRGRPSLFSNAVPATVARSARQAIEIVEREPHRVTKLHANVRVLRDGFKKLGFDCHACADRNHSPHDRRRSGSYSQKQTAVGTGSDGDWVWFSLAVSKGTARLRVQVSAALEPQHLEQVLAAFAKL